MFTFQRLYKNVESKITHDMKNLVIIVDNCAAHPPTNTTATSAPFSRRWYAILASTLFIYLALNTLMFYTVHM